MKAAKQFGWSKTELITKIAENAHENVVLATEDKTYNVVKYEKRWTESKVKVKDTIQQLVCSIRKWGLIWRESRRRWHTYYVMGNICWLVFG